VSLILTLMAGDNGSRKPYQPEYKTLSRTLVLKERERVRGGITGIYPLGKSRNSAQVRGI
jgi:hypothetical protein